MEEGDDSFILFEGGVSDAPLGNRGDSMRAILEEMYGDGNDGYPLHGACMKGNVIETRALLARGADPNIYATDGMTAVHFACLYHHPDVLKLLCAAGAKLRERASVGYWPLNLALDDCRHDPDSMECAKILLSNGVRLSTVKYGKVPPAVLISFEIGILKIRSAVVALLKVKDRGGLHRWDRFLLKEIALQIWAARAEWEE